ncbi:MAG: hypothetical protein KF891_12205 [Rhizobacter sp.]|nr:hypothetical protein [Rhizobacter sp.]
MEAASRVGKLRWHISPRRAGGVLPTGVLVGALVAMLVWGVVSREPPSRDVACCGPQRVDAVALPLRAPAPALPEMVGPSREVEPIGWPPAAGRAEVCGYGEVQLAPDDPDPVQRIPWSLRQAALERMDTLMLASDDTQVRAAALWMGARLRGREVRGRIEQVARLAAGSQDPFVYALALEACQGVTPAEGGSCQLLSIAQWVRLDPDNAVPWRVLADQAQASDDVQAEASARALASRALRSDVYAGRLPRLVDHALGTQVSPLQRTLALEAAWSADAVWSASHGAGVARETVVAQGVDLSCEGLARRLG